MPPKISLAELYTLKDKREFSKYITFDNIINICHKSIYLDSKKLKFLESYEGDKSIIIRTTNYGSNANIDKNECSQIKYTTGDTGNNLSKYRLTSSNSSHKIQYFLSAVNQP